MSQTTDPCARTDRTAAPATLFVRLGGAPTVRAVVDEFYDRVLGDEQLAPFFVDTDLRRQKAHQAVFIGALLGAADGYQGKDMQAAHAGRGIGDSHFDRVAGHLQGTLEALGVGAADVATIMAAAAGLRGDVVGS